MLTAAVLSVGTLAQAGDEHEKITGPFATPMDVTRKCLECHEDASSDVMKTSHWTWALEQEIPEKGTSLRGKKNVLNNFCGSVGANLARCTSCHISYGWKDASFDFTDQSRVDCLACHDNTGTYRKPGPAAGMPPGYTGDPIFDNDPVDLVYIAQNVSKPIRDNCGLCHFYGGGGNAVKHGDLDSTLFYPEKETDVHMAVDGNNFQCQDCHNTENHDIKGHSMLVSPRGANHVNCVDCHDQAPHSESLLNNHTASVACQTCHIPSFARELPTKLSWDWSTAGKEVVEAPVDKYGKETYSKKKGDFVWGKNVGAVLDNENYLGWPDEKK